MIMGAKSFLSERCIHACWERVVEIRSELEVMIVRSDLRSVSRTERSTEENTHSSKQKQ